MASALEGLARIAQLDNDPDVANVLLDEARSIRNEQHRDDAQRDGRTRQLTSAKSPDEAGNASEGGHTTARLIALARIGDTGAREQLAGRYLPVLHRFAQGRLPPHARGLLDTDDLVHVTIERALDHLAKFEAKRPGAFLAYLRTILKNQILDEVRRASRFTGSELTEDIPGSDRSPEDEAAERETLARYEAALVRLPEGQRWAVMLRLELEMTYPELAQALGQASPDAARMMFTRGITKLLRIMNAPQTS